MLGAMGPQAVEYKDKNVNEKNTFALGLRGHGAREKEYELEKPKA